jgi:hypothetical protein
MLTVIRRTWYALYFDRLIQSAANGGIDVFPHELVIIGNQPKTYKWAENLYENLNKPEAYKKFQKASQWLDE